MMHAFKLSSHGRVREISKFEATCTGNLGQPGLYSETKSQNKSHTQNNNKIAQKNNNTTTIKLGNQES